MAAANTPIDSTRRDTPVPLRPERELLQRVLGSGGDALRQCMQCATCSAVCELASAEAPLPRKEMLWAQWGLRDRLMSDVDLWLCHECHDCTRRCPRGARPGDVMAALRRECIAYYSVPRWLGRVANDPSRLPWVLSCAALVLGCGILLWNGMGLGVRELAVRGERIVMPFSPLVPHGLLMTLFGTLLLFDCVVLGIGLRRFWNALSTSVGLGGTEERVSPEGPAIGRVLERVLWHQDFSRCTEQAPRRGSHSLVLYSILALLLVDLWVITARFNPLLVGLVYPLGTTDAWKLLANLAGVTLMLGCLLMARDRLRRRASARARPTGTYSDWLLLGLLLSVAATGFVTEGLHLLRLEGPRFWAYMVHLITVLTLFALLPYSKLAHVAFRTVALIAAEKAGHSPTGRGAHRSHEGARMNRGDA